MKGYVFYLDLLGISHISRIPDDNDISSFFCSS